MGADQLNILIEVMTELDVLITRWMCLLISVPHIVQIGLAAFPMNPIVDGFKIRHDVLRFPVDIGGG